MIARLQTAIIVTIITLLVWVLAEGQTLRVQSATAEIRFDAGSTTRVIRVEPGQTFSGRAELSFSGSTRRVNEFAAQLREPIVLKAGTDLVSEPGIQVVDLRETLRRSELLSSSGLALTEIEPRFVRVEVDSLEAVDVPVRIDLADAAVDGQPRAEPATVRYELPSAALASVDRETLFVTARVSAIETAALPTGSEQKLPNVRVVPSPALASMWNVRRERDDVAISLTLRSRLMSITLATVPVHVQAAPAEMIRFDVVIDPEDSFVADVSLRGPVALIERIQNDASLRPIAVLSLSFDDLERGVITSKAAVLRLPPGFEAVEARAENLQIGFRVIRREQAEPASP